MPFKKITKLIFTLGVLGIFVLIFIKMKNGQDALKAKHLSTLGTITKWNKLKKSNGYMVFYKYEANGKVYESSDTYMNLTEQEVKGLLGRNLPVIYSPEDPSTHELLDYEQQYLLYGVPITDSAKVYFKIFKFE